MLWDCFNVDFSCKFCATAPKRLVNFAVRRGGHICTRWIAVVELSRCKTGGLEVCQACQWHLEVLSCQVRGSCCWNRCCEGRSSAGARRSETAAIFPQLLCCRSSTAARAGSRYGQETWNKGAFLSGEMGEILSFETFSLD